MNFPTNFEKEKASEIGNLVKQAYLQFDAHRKGKDWNLDGNYDLVCPITYNWVNMGFEVGVDDPSNQTLIDDEVNIVEAENAESGDASYGLVDLFKDYPMGFVATSKDGKNAYLIFRGTVTGQEFIKDAKIILTPYLLPKFGNVSVGFLEVYNACSESFINKLNGLAPNLNFYIGGHSLGGALSVLALPDVVMKTHYKQPILYNFGCPRVGDNTFVSAYNALAGKQRFRVVNSSDLVPTLPPPAPIYYSHVDLPVEFNVQTDSVSKNHSMDTYIAALR